MKNYVPDKPHYTAQDALKILELAGHPLSPDLATEFTSIYDHIPDKKIAMPFLGELPEWATFTVVTLEILRNLIPEYAAMKDWHSDGPITQALEEKGIVQMLHDGLSVEDISKKLGKN